MVADPPVGAECPPGVACDFVPAAYAQTAVGDPTAYGNYDRADRPRDGNDIRYILIHDTEESYDAAMRAFRTATSGVSAHYLIDAPSGRITQVVPTRDIAFHAGNYWFNTHSIGIEHVGVLAEGRRWYTEEVYQASARLVRYLAERYHIPLDREHILGHEDIPGSTPNSAKGMHYDPGPYWDWDHYFSLLGVPLPDARWSRRYHPELAVRRGTVSEQLPGYRPWPDGGGYPPRVVTISPGFARNVRERLTRCAGDRCVDQPPQPSNVVYLHTAPAAESPLLSDPLLHPDGEPGDTLLDDWSAKVTVGESFVVAGRVSGWTAIWFGGQRGWFADPDAEPRSATRPTGTLLTPRPGCSTIPVYGAAHPEPSAYPPSIEPITITRLPYVIPAGQVYLGVDMIRAASYHTRFDPTDSPTEGADHTLVTGRRTMWEISFNHRRAFLDAADVQPFSPRSSPPASTPVPCANPEPPPRVVTVRPGDTLDALARAHHVPGGWRALYQANRSQISSPWLIRPGQHLVLP